MKRFNYVIKDELGIHARPAGLLVKMVQGYKSTVKIEKGDKEIDARRLMMLMGLGVKKGDEIGVRVDGCDEDVACEELEKFFRENL